MRILAAAVTGFLAFTTTAVNAAVPKPMVALLGPSVGYLLSQSDLCQWGIGERIRKTYQDGFEAIGMTAAQQSDAWQQAAATLKRMRKLHADAQARMKTDTCTPVMRARVKHDLTE